MARYNFDTNIPELIRRLGLNLYNDPMVAIRELLQNANDACILAEGLLGSRRGRIDISFDTHTHVLKVTDNGIGMTADDLGKFLSTIASSQKAEIRRKLENQQFDAARGIAGQFGIGFLSTFIIAEQVEVRTRHQSEVGPGSEWRSLGDGSYDLTPSIKPLPRGTSITLTLKPEFHRQVTPVAISEALEKHCPFIRTPYHVNGSGLPVNHELPPWEVPEDSSLADTYMRASFNCRPLVGFYLHYDGPMVIEQSSIPRLRVAAYLAIPDKKIWGQHPRVYTSGLYVGEFAQGVPSWARFVLGGIECPDLDLTLGRDNVMKNTTWEAAQKIVADMLISAMVKDLSDKRSRLRDKWASVFTIHDEEVMRAAVDNASHGDGRFYAAVKDLIPFRIGTERLSISRAIEQGKSIEKSGKKILFYHSQGSRRHESAGIQEALLFDEVGMSFINAKNYYERDFLQQYSRDAQGLEIVPVEEGLEHVLDFSTDQAESRLVADVFQSLGLQARLAKFKPDELAAVILPVASRVWRSEHGNIESQDSPDPSTPVGRERLMELLAGSGSGALYKPYSICVNTNNILIQELLRYAQKHGVDSHIKAAFLQVYYMAVLIFGDTNTQVLAQMAPGLSGLMLSFIRRSSEQEIELVRIRQMLVEERQLNEEAQSVRKPKLSTVHQKSVFLAYGYDEETVSLVKPFKDLLIDRGIRIMDGQVGKAGSLSKQIISKIEQCSMFVGILTPRERLDGRADAITSTWVIEEKGVAAAFDLPVLMIVDKNVSKTFYGNIEGDSLRLEVGDQIADWLNAYRNAVNIIVETLKD